MESLLGLGEACADVGVTDEVSAHTRRTALKCVSLIVAHLDSSQSSRVQKVSIVG